VATASGSLSRSQSKRDRSCRSKIATSPSRTSVAGAMAEIAAHGSGARGPRPVDSPAAPRGRPCKPASGSHRTSPRRPSRRDGRASGPASASWGHIGRPPSNGHSTGAVVAGPGITPPTAAQPPRGPLNRSPRRWHRGQSRERSAREACVPVNLSVAAQGPLSPHAGLFAPPVQPDADGEYDEHTTVPLPSGQRKPRSGSAETS
jgi:hypothetical protein